MRRYLIFISPRGYSERQPISSIPPLEPVDRLLHWYFLNQQGHVSWKLQGLALHIAALVNMMFIASFFRMCDIVHYIIAYLLLCISAWISNYYFGSTAMFT